MPKGICKPKVHAHQLLSVSQAPRVVSAVEIIFWLGALEISAALQATDWIVFSLIETDLK